MKKNIFAIAVLSLIGLSSSLYAFTVETLGTEIKVQYEEPSENANATPLTDLDFTTIYYKTDAQIGIKLKTIPATSPNGGGLIDTTVFVSLPEDAEANVTLWATATDTSGNQSVKSSEAVVRVDRLPPAAPK